MKKKLVRAYIGVIGSGKGYSSEKAGGKIVSFADPVREGLWTILGWRPKSEEEYREFKNTEFILPGGKRVLGRKLLTGFGTDYMRELFGEDYWANKTVDIIKDLLSGNCSEIDIPDCRFASEIKALIDLENSMEDVEVKFIHCDYHSDEYDDSFNHSSEYIAQGFAGRLFTGDRFDCLVKTRFK